jgi:hypothetical protein
LTLFNYLFSIYQVDSVYHNAMIKQPVIPDTHVLFRLPREDLDLIVRFLLVSGSLKDLADQCDVSYPTIRKRLDGIIERLRVLLTQNRPDPLADLLATLVARGELSIGNAHAIRDLVRTLTQQQEREGEP